MVLLINEGILCDQAYVVNIDYYSSILNNGGRKDMQL